MSVKIGFRSIDTATQFLRRKALAGGLIQKACWEYFIRCRVRGRGGRKKGDRSRVRMVEKWR